MVDQTHGPLGEAAPLNVLAPISKIYDENL